MSKKSPLLAQNPAATPMPDYEKMLSPALRKELRKFGLKVIPRRKALPLLKHIYEETHPQVRKKVEFSEELPNSSQESNDDSFDFPEESIIGLEVENLSQNEEGDLHEKLIKMIQNDPELNRKALMYEPLWLEDLFAKFKEVLNGVPVKINQVQDILDFECITFRTRAREKGNKKRNAKKS